MNIDSMSILEIEDLLKIKPINHTFDQSEKKEKTIFDTWGKVQRFMKENNSNGCMYRSFRVVGYKLIVDNHLIEIYHKTDVFNT